MYYMIYQTKCKKCPELLYSLNTHLQINILVAMSKTPHTQYLCMFARHGNLFYHSKFIVTTSSKWYN